MSKIFLAFVDQHKFGGVGIQSFIKYRGKQFPYPAQNRNWSIIVSLASSDFPLLLNMEIIFRDSHITGTFPESNIQLNNLT